jgi:hypothetical protein
MSVENPEPRVMGVKHEQGVAFTEEAAKTIMKAGMTPVSPEEAMDSLRRVFPPGATVYTVELTRPTDDASSIAVFGKVKSVGGSGKRPFQNFSWYVSRIGACPLADDGRIRGVKVADTDVLLAILARAIWLEPTVELRLTRLQRWQLHRARRREAVVDDALSYSTPKFFEHENIR